MITIQARWFTEVGPQRKKQLIVLHSMEAPNKPTTAEGVGLFFKNLPPTNKASAHVGADFNSRVRYVSDNDVAYAAPGSNHNGLHQEQTGYASYTRGEWTQPDMMLMLQLAATQVREWSDEYGIPLRFIDANQLRKADPQNLPSDCFGVTTHWEVSQAWRKTDHHDPGRGYPINTLLAMARAPRDFTGNDENMAPYIHVERNNGPGYWLVKPSDGGVFAYDGAPFFGSMAGRPLQAPIVDAASTETGNGYYLLGADGGVFCFGDAQFTDSYAGHPEWQNGSRVFVGIEPHGVGYDLISVELQDGQLTDPPVPNKYDLSEKR